MDNAGLDNAGSVIAARIIIEHQAKSILHELGQLLRENSVRSVFQSQTTTGLRFV
jgi:hypothetical protein